MKELCVTRACDKVVCVRELCEKELCVTKLCAKKMRVKELCEKKLCGKVVCVCENVVRDKEAEEEAAEEVDGSAQQKNENPTQ